MKISKKLEKTLNDNNITFLLKDCESISKEINEPNLDFEFSVCQLDFGTKMGKLLCFTSNKRDRKIIVTKNYNYIPSSIINLKFSLKNKEFK